MVNFIKFGLDYTYSTGQVAVQGAAQAISGTLQGAAAVAGGVAAAAGGVASLANRTAAIANGAAAAAKNITKTEASRNEEAEKLLTDIESTLETLEQKCLQGSKELDKDPEEYLDPKILKLAQSLSEAGTASLSASQNERYQILLSKHDELTSLIKIVKGIYAKVKTEDLVEFHEILRKLRFDSENPSKFQDLEKKILSKITEQDDNLGKRRSELAVKDRKNAPNINEIKRKISVIRPKTHPEPHTEDELVSKITELSRINLDITRLKKELARSELDPKARTFDIILNLQKQVEELSQSFKDKLLIKRALG